MAIAVGDSDWNRKGGHRKEDGVIGGIEKLMVGENGGGRESPRVRKRAR